MLTQTLALMIPIISIVMGIGVAMLAIFLSYRKRKEMFTLHHQERMAAIEKGIELPPFPEALFTDDGRPPRPYNPRRHLLKGLCWLFVGLGLAAGLWATVGYERALFSLILIGIGFAHLIYYFVEGKKEADALDNRVPPVHASA